MDDVKVYTAISITMGESKFIHPSFRQNVVRSTTYCRVFPKITNKANVANVYVAACESGYVKGLLCCLLIRHDYTELHWLSRTVL